eukprot:g2293.t1
MGAACGAAAQQRRLLLQSGKVDERNKLDFLKDAQRTKILLCGLDGAGKRSIMKQVELQFGTHTHTLQERTKARTAIHRDVIASLKILCENAAIFGDGVDSAILNEFAWITPEHKLEGADLTRLLATIWSDPGVQLAFESRNEFDLPLGEATAQFLDNLDALAKPSYLPDEKDIMLHREKRSGVVELRCDVGDASFSLTDIGGQTTKLRKWLHIFDQYDAVLFVASLTNYREKLTFLDREFIAKNGPPNSSPTRMHEAVQRYSLIRKHLGGKPHVVVLNKVDAFQRAIAQVGGDPCQYVQPDGTRPWKECPRREGFASDAQHLDAAIEYFSTLFEDPPKSSAKVVATRHVQVTAMDGASVRDAFGKVMASIIAQEEKNGRRQRNWGRVAGAGKMMTSIPLNVQGGRSKVPQLVELVLLSLEIERVMKGALYDTLRKCRLVNVPKCNVAVSLWRWAASCVAYQQLIVSQLDRDSTHNDSKAGELMVSSEVALAGLRGRPLIGTTDVDESLAVALRAVAVICDEKKAEKSINLALSS